MTIKVTEDNVAKGMTPNCISSETAGVVEFATGGDVASHIRLDTTFTIFRQLDPFVNTIGIWDTLAIRIVEFLVRIYGRSRRRRRYFQTYVK
jgi:hypothetical protein